MIFTRFCTGIILLILKFTFIYNVTAQSPYASIGINKEILSLSKGKYNEIPENDTIIKIGSVLFNLKAQQIWGFVEYDTIRFEHKLEPEVTSRWWGRDPQEDKYVGYSPYHFGANNPIIIIDPNGEEWVAVVNKETRTITVTFTGKLIDETKSLNEKDLNAYAERINTAISKAYSGETASGYTVVTTSKITVLKEGEVLSEKDHALRIVNQMPKEGEENNAGLAEAGGNFIYINSKILNNAPEDASTGLTNDGKATLERTVAHEAGHTAGLYHPGDAKSSLNCDCQQNESLGKHKMPWEYLKTPNLMFQSNSKLAGSKLLPKQFSSFVNRILDTQAGYNKTKEQQEKETGNSSLQDLPVNSGPQQYEKK